MSEHKGHKFAAVFEAVRGGQAIDEALKANCVSDAGYKVWCKRHNFDYKRKSMTPNSVFKAAEREIRAGKIFFVAQKYGVHIIDIYRRKTAKAADREMLERAFSEVNNAESTEAICKKHGITRGQLYYWRHATGGLPKTPPIREISE